MKQELEISQNTEQTTKMEQELALEYIEVSLSIAERVNEGKNAYILSIDNKMVSDAISDDYIKIFDDKHQDDQNQESAIKLLKIFKSGSAEREIENQLKVADIINNSEVSDLIGIPEILNRNNHSIHINDYEGIKKHLHLSELPKDIEFVIMDMIDGVDLATLAYGNALIDMINEDIKEGFSDSKKRAIYSMIRNKLDFHPAESEMEADYNLIEDDNERIRIMKLIEPMLYGLKGTNYDFLKIFDSLTEGDQILIDDVSDIRSELDLLKIIEEDGDVDLSNYILSMRDALLLEKVIVDLGEGEISDIAGSDTSIVSMGKKREKAFLSMVKKRISGKKLVKPELVKALATAISLLHDNGVYHCDLHERNIMIGADGKKLFIIDFDSVGNNDDDSFVKDEAIVSPEGLLSAMV